MAVFRCRQCTSLYDVRSGEPNHLVCVSSTCPGLLERLNEAAALACLRISLDAHYLAAGTAEQAERIAQGLPPGGAHLSGENIIEKAIELCDRQAIREGTMSEIHSPGPWKWRRMGDPEKHPWAYEIQVDGHTIFSTWPKTREADRLLVAAAPDMLAALIAIRDVKMPVALAEQIDLAIAKAVGELV